MIVGLTGRARSGKDTAAAILSKKLKVYPLSFADPLKQAAMAMFGITFEMAHGIGYDRELIVEPWGISVREMLQKLGTECARKVFRDDFWMVRADITLECDMTYVNGFICTDIRFDNEAQWVKDKGGIILSLHRSQGAIADDHASEKGVSSILIDHYVPNEGTISDLEVLLSGVFDGRYN